MKGIWGKRLTLPLILHHDEKRDVMKQLNNNNSGLVAAVLLGAFLVEAVLLLVPGRLAINGHEVDAIHAMGAALSIAGGAMQHQDFVTPLGVLSFLPVAMFIKAGFGAGTSFILAHLLVAVVLAPMVWHVAASRMSAVAGAVFAAVIMILATALVYGGDQATISISMFYNRWAWAFYFLIVAIMLLPGQNSGLLDAIIIGLCLSILALLKATFFVTLAPVVGVWILLNKDIRTGVTVAAVGAVAVVLATIAFGGLGFWASYIADLRFVSASEVRPAPGQSLGSLTAAPAYFAGSLCLLAAIIGLRKTQMETNGLLLLLLAPGFIFITYQNWGNDPKWLILLGFLALGWRSQASGEFAGVDGKTFFGGLGVVCFALSMPTLLNLTLSPLRHFSADTNKHVAIAADPNHADLLIEKDRSYLGEASVDLAIRGAEPAEALDFAGIDLGGCTQRFGYFGKMKEISDDLHAKGHSDQLIAFVDVTNPLPLIGGFSAIPGDPPWYYGGTVAIDAADLVVVPKCPVSKVTFAAYIKELAKLPGDWAMVDESEHYRIFKRQ